MFADYLIIPVESASGMRKSKHTTERVIVQEVLVTNFAPPIAASGRTTETDQKRLF